MGACQEQNNRKKSPSLHTHNWLSYSKCYENTDGNWMTCGPLSRSLHDEHILIMDLLSKDLVHKNQPITKTWSKLEYRVGTVLRFQTWDYYRVLTLGSKTKECFNKLLWTTWYVFLHDYFPSHVVYGTNWHLGPIYKFQAQWTQTTSLKMAKNTWGGRGMGGRVVMNVHTICHM